MGTKYIPKNDAVIFTSNHQNALIDALLIAVYNGRGNLFLTRASVFSNPVIARILKSLDMYPVFRVRDGWSSLDNNQDSFKKCIECLSNKGSVVIFPEGNHDLRRRLRPLSKGFTRIAFGALDIHPEMRLRIVPVGVNYENHTAMRTSVSIHFGEPILVDGFYNAGNFQESSLALKTAVSERMKRLISHLPEENYSKIEDELSKEFDFLDPDKVNEAVLRGSISRNRKQKRKENLLGRLLYAVSHLINLPPLALRNHIIKGLRDPVFEGTVKYVFVLAVFPLYYTILATTMLLLSNPLSALVLFISCVFSMLLLKP